jgi:hypothetical protein
MVKMMSEEGCGGGSRQRKDCSSVTGGDGLFYGGEELDGCLDLNAVTCDGGPKSER